VEEDNFVAALEWGEKLGADVVSASLGYDQWYTWSDLNGKYSALIYYTILFKLLKFIPGF
jgi:hypothetical protein